MDAYQVGLILAYRTAGFQKEATIGTLLGRMGKFLSANKRNIAYGIGVPVAAGIAGLAGYGYTTDPKQRHAEVLPRPQIDPQILGHTF